MLGACVCVCVSVGIIDHVSVCSCAVVYQCPWPNSAACALYTIVCPSERDLWVSCCVSVRIHVCCVIVRPGYSCVFYHVAG